MKITFLMHTSPRLVGGGPKMIYEYANALSKNGNEVSICFMGNQILSHKGIPEPLRRILARREIARRPNWFELDERVRKIAVFDVSNAEMPDADVIIATDVRTAEPVSRLSDSKGRKFQFVQGYENWVLSDEDVLRTYELPLRHITVSRWLTEMVDSRSSSPSILVSNPIDTDVFRLTDEPRKPHSLVFHYRSAAIKGPKVAFETVRLLEKRYPDLSVTVVSLEDAPDNLPSSCVYKHHISVREVAAVNNRSQVFLCSSISEGFGLPGLEAMACGCALVSTDYEAVHDYAEDGVNALLVPLDDRSTLPQRLADQIGRLFDDEALRLKISQNGVRAAAKRSIEAASRQFEAALHAGEEC